MPAKKRITSTVAAQLAKALVLGVSRRAACKANKVSWSTFGDSVQRDAALRELLDAAEGKGVIFHAKRFRTARSYVQLRASIVYLATHDREAWSQQVNVNHSGAIGTLADLMKGADGKTSAAAAAGGLAVPLLDDDFEAPLGAKA